jgi:hypothetical protein
LLVCAAVLAACLGMARASLIDESLEALAARPDPGDHFSFVVLADTHAGLTPEESVMLRANMREIALLRPELVLAAGDLIKGSAIDTLDREWAQAWSDSKLCGAPFFPVPGNHDTAGPETSAMWEKLYGPLRYSFDRGNVHFVGLNTMEAGGLQSPAVLAWLQADLAATKAKHIVVFQHDPLWAGDWTRWQPIHNILRQYPVRLVVAGHWHSYHKFDPVDGIQYLVLPAVNGITPQVTPEQMAEGHFCGYLLVNVRGDEISFAPIRAGSIYPPEVSLMSTILERERLRRQAVQAPVIGYTFGRPVERTIRVKITNPYPRPLASTLTWQTEGKWQVAPPSAKYQAPANGDTVLTFALRAPADGVMYPTPAYSTEYLYGAAQEKKLLVRGRLELRPSFAVAHVDRPLAVDGNLDEWQGVPSVPLGYASRISITEVDNLSAQVQWQWDESNLYLAVTVRDNVFYQPYTGDGVWQADCLEMTFDPAADGNAQGHRQDDCDFSMARVAAGVQPWVARSPDGFEGVASDIPLAVERRDNYTLYEFAIPASRLGLAGLQAGKHVGYSLAVQDLDGNVPGQRHWWVELLPGVGGGSYPCPLFDLVLR